MPGSWHSPRGGAPLGPSEPLSSRSRHNTGRRCHHLAWLSWCQTSGERLLLRVRTHRVHSLTLEAGSTEGCHGPQSHRQRFSLRVSEPSQMSRVSQSPSTELWCHSYHREGPVHHREASRMTQAAASRRVTTPFRAAGRRLGLRGWSVQIQIQTQGRGARNLQQGQHPRRFPGRLFQGAIRPSGLTTGHAGWPDSWALRASPRPQDVRLPISVQSSGAAISSREKL